ncbi:MAG: ABC transporter ATP-binding protein [Thermotogae bacterium]|nr:ABC transporter ATP-binding protein [Kosmotoga sp.]MBO8166525.1 ABC transporter ATP-binding protein [Kosmotoga sp.]MCD6160175.1 ABC transporter ATP-binding protein [Kosmotoga sp.]RKX48842.1 MAG: ABC transporter ATP-binding protein [Thermotogota bacterium]
MITLKNVTKIYTGGIKAADGLSLEVKEGEIFGFLGPNGAGKSTTIKMITGVIEPTEGTVEICGINMAKDPVKAKSFIGYVADEPLVMEKLKGIEYLNFIMNVFQVPKELRTQRIERLLEDFKLSHAIMDPINTYSHGMKQKLSLIAALSHNPKVWVLDEPIVGLDPESAFILKKMMRNHANSGNTVFFSTHVMEIAEKICDRIGIIQKGKLEFVGTVEELRKLKGSGTLEELFLEVTKSEIEKMDFSYLDNN